MTFRVEPTVKAGILTYVVSRIDADGPGLLKLYTGAQPLSISDSPTGDLLATAVLDVPSFVIVGDEGQATIPTPPTAVATGDAGWFRIETGTGGRIFDGKAGALADTSAQLKLPSTSISSGAPVEISSLTLRVGG